MKQSWNDYDAAAEKGPLAISIKILIGFSILVALTWAIGAGFGWFGEAEKVARDEFGARASLDKYEWFKDTSAALDQKLATIKVYKARVNKLENRAESGNDNDKEALAQAETELIGVIASYNDLASKYNAQMKKFNWQFANAGELPQGADKPLPREYKPYISE